MLTDHAVDVHENRVLESVHFVGYVVVVRCVYDLRKLFRCVFDVSIELVGECQITMGLGFEGSPVIYLFGDIQTVGIGVVLLEVVSKSFVKESIF